MQAQFSFISDFLSQIMGGEWVNALADILRGAWEDGSGQLALLATFILVVGILIGRVFAPSASAAAEETKLLPPPGRDNRPSSEQLQALELGVDIEIINNFRRFLDTREPAVGDVDAELTQMCRNYRALRHTLSAVPSGSESFLSSLEDVYAILDSGDFGAAFDTLHLAAKHAEDDAKKLQFESEKHSRTAAAGYMVAGDLCVVGDDFQGAMKAYKQALNVLPPLDARKRSEYLGKLGTAAFRANMYDAAIKTFAQQVDCLEKELGVEHPDIAAALSNLGLACFEQGDYAKAKPFYQRALSIDEAALGANDPGVASDLNNLALLYKKEGALAQAEPLFKRALFIKEKHYPAGHPSLLLARRNYAALLREMGREAEAAVMEQQARG